MSESTKDGVAARGHSRTTSGEIIDALRSCRRWRRITVAAVALVALGGGLAIGYALGPKLGQVAVGKNCNIARLYIHRGVVDFGFGKQHQYAREEWVEPWPTYTSWITATGRRRKRGPLDLRKVYNKVSVGSYVLIQGRQDRIFVDALLRGHPQYGSFILCPNSISAA